LNNGDLEIKNLTTILGIIKHYKYIKYEDRMKCFHAGGLLAAEELKRKVIKTNHQVSII
jgi:hypothetical protein